MRTRLPNSDLIQSTCPLASKFAFGNANHAESSFLDSLAQLLNNHARAEHHNEITLRNELHDYGCTNKEEIQLFEFELEKSFNIYNKYNSHIKYTKDDMRLYNWLESMWTSGSPFLEGRIICAIHKFSFQLIQFSYDNETQQYISKCFSIDGNNVKEIEEGQLESSRLLACVDDDYVPLSSLPAPVVNLETPVSSMPEECSDKGKTQSPVRNMVTGLTIVVGLGFFAYKVKNSDVLGKCSSFVSDLLR